MEHLKAYMSARGINQRQMADALGVSPGTISRLLSDLMSPSLELAVKIERLTRGRVKAASWVPDVAHNATTGAENQQSSERAVE